MLFLTLANGQYFRYSRRTEATAPTSSDLTHGHSEGLGFKQTGCLKVDLFIHNGNTMDKKTEEQLQDYKRYKEVYDDLPWRAWGSWFSWGSPVGLGLALISVGVFLWLLHMANLIG